ncbi:sigma-70 family RNA polymerase sigma factor [soil metagenome]
MGEIQANAEDSSGGTLPPELYDQLRAIAHVRMSHERIGHTLQTTALVHEALMRMTQGGRISTSARPEFFRAAAASMRRILIDHARANRSAKRGGGARRVSLDDVDPPAAEPSVDLLALDEAISRLENSAPDSAEVVRLRFYAGLSVDETAETMNVSPRTVDRLWTYARARLWEALSAGDGDHPEAQAE